LRWGPSWGMARAAAKALLAAAELGPSAEHLISLLAPNGLRVSEATGADIEHLGLERGHRTLVITRKGGRVVTILRPNRCHSGLWVRGRKKRFRSAIKATSAAVLMGGVSPEAPKANSAHGRTLVSAPGTWPMAD
jgi:integrase